MRRDAGFTLLEIIVAVVVFGFVLAGLSQATRFGITAWDVQTREAGRAAELERVDRLLRLLVNGAVAPLSADDKPFHGEEHRLEFITRLPDQPPTDPIRRAKVAIGVDDEHRLVLRWLPSPNATAIRKLPPPEEIVLAEGIEHLDLRYRQRADDGGKWLGVWKDPALPALVQIQVGFQSERRRWPVFQIATLLDTNGSF